MVLVPFVLTLTMFFSALVTGLEPPRVERWELRTGYAVLQTASLKT